MHTTYFKTIILLKTFVQNTIVNSKQMLQINNSLELQDCCEILQVEIIIPRITTKMIEHRIGLLKM